VLNPGSSLDGLCSYGPSSRRSIIWSVSGSRAAALGGLPWKEVEAWGSEEMVSFVDVSTDSIFEARGT
jgi:hypothetical protein